MNWRGWIERTKPYFERAAQLVGLSGWRAGAWLAGGVAALLLIAVAGIGPGGLRDRARLTPPQKPPEVIGFFENGWDQTFRDSFPSLQRGQRLIDTVLAFWYSVDESGNLRASKPRPDVVAWAKSHHMRAGVLINNIGHDNAGMLWTDSVRKKAINAIVSRAKADGYQEIHIDFELLPPDARDSLTTFIRELRSALPHTILLSVSVFPQVDVPHEIWGAYDYAALARSADYLVLMAYDKNSSGGPAGPVSPLPWVESNVKAMLNLGVPRQKLVLAAGIYGYDWIVGTTKATDLPLSGVQSLASKHGVQTQWDTTSSEPYLHYRDAYGALHVVWYQDARTVKQRVQLVRQYNLRGIAIWRLGYETPVVWEVLQQTTK